LRQALLICEQYKVQSGDFKEGKPIPEPDWKKFIVKTANLITNERAIDNIMMVREHLYELLANGIPPEIILQDLVKALVVQCDKQIIPQVSHYSLIFSLL